MHQRQTAVLHGGQHHVSVGPELQGSVLERPAAPRHCGQHHVSVGPEFFGRVLERQAVDAHGGQHEPPVLAGRPEVLREVVRLRVPQELAQQPHDAVAHGGHMLARVLDAIEDRVPTAEDQLGRAVEAHGGPDCFLQVRQAAGARAFEDDIPGEQGHAETRRRDDDGVPPHGETSGDAEVARPECD